METVAQPITDEGDLNPCSPALLTAVPTPQWAATFQKYLGSAPGGYAYCIGQNGEVSETGSSGYARMSQDTPGGVQFTTNTRCNLASVSKTLTATAVFTMIGEAMIQSVNDLFWPYIAPLYPNLQPAAGVETITIAELLTMTARLPKDGTLYTSSSADKLVGQYLQSNAVITWQRYVYSNMNFTILQAMMDSICQNQGGDYVSWVNSSILSQLGINLNSFSPVPDDAADATLSYSLSNPSGNGKYWPEMQCIGPGGWIASATDTLTYLMGFRNDKVIRRGLSNFMMERMLGWYPGATCYGLCYHHNGGLESGSGQGLNTGIIRFPNGYDAVLLANSPLPNIIGVMIEAFDAS